MANQRIWERFLTPQDQAHIAAQPAQRKGTGTRPALLLVDLYRAVFGDRPQPLLEAITTWPDSCGLAGWEALPHIQRLLDEARRAGIPVLHVTGNDELPGWRSQRGTTPADEAPSGRRAKRYEIVDELAPIDGESVLRKIAPSAFHGTPLVGLLVSLGIDTLVVAGESTSGCVRATVVDGRSYRFRMVVVEECVFDRHEAAHAINLFDMDQKYADVVPLDEAVAYIRECSKQSSSLAAV